MTIAKRHNWSHEISAVLRGANEEARKSMRLIVPINAKKQVPTIQQIHNNSVGLQVDLPKAYNNDDATELRNVAKLFFTEII